MIAVTAEAGATGLTHLILEHEGGASSTATVTLGAPAAAEGLDLQLWGDAGRSVMPALADEPHAALQAALTELAAAIRSGERGHPCDVQFGWQVWCVLDEAQKQIDSRRRR